MAYVHATNVLYQYFHKKKALVQGIQTACAAIAGVYWPIGVRGLIDTVGYRWSNRVIGFIYIPFMTMATILLKPRLPPPKRKPGQNFLRINFRVILNYRFMTISLCFMLFIMSLFPGLFYIDLFCKRIQVSENLTKYSVAIVNASACFGRIIPGYVADKVGRLNILIPFMILCGIFPLAIWMNVRSTGGTAAFCVLWGFVSGAPVSLMPSLVGQLFPAEDLPSYLSFFFTFGGIGALIGPIIAGTFIPKGDVIGDMGFNKLAIYVGVFELAVSFILIILRCCYTRKLMYKI
ncbi:unnamed protein product [Ambrosiozyma monospora]|uniref:Unnamed protein product n=1 Tax=Ambrosiozyma monospora TaxID=43982 RepID=A0ACB5T8Y3_AMBMO|nr:unnamed protein product [Ambrosiozyma monospora]